MELNIGLCLRSTLNQRGYLFDILYVDVINMKNTIIGTVIVKFNAVGKAKTMTTWITGLFTKLMIDEAATRKISDAAIEEAKNVAKFLSE